MMKLTAISFLLLWLAGCATPGRVTQGFVVIDSGEHLSLSTDTPDYLLEVSNRPTQGLNNSCGLYALADAIEIQTHKSISREERLRVWRTFRDPDRVTVDDCLTAAQIAGWVSDKAWLCASELDTINGPLLADIGGHLVCILSVSSGKVMYLDPRYVDPESVTVRQMERMHRGMYWRIRE
jgi:hypothetical protein